LFAYAILRSLPGKLTGVIGLVSRLGILFVLCLFPSPMFKRLTYYGPLKAYYWSLVACFLLLTIAGSWPVAPPFLVLRR